MKILYYFCGEGLGHSTRTLAAGKKLIQNYDVVFASYGYARDFVVNNGLPVFDVPSEIKLVGGQGSLDLGHSIKSSLSKLNAKVVFAHDQFIKNHKPDLVISDSFFLPAALAKARKIPVWMIVNQTNVDKFFAESGEHIRWIGNAIKQINYSVLESLDKILIPDFPPPFTVCSKNLSLSQKLYSKTEYIGPLLQKNLLDFKRKKTRKKNILAFIRGFSSDSKMVEKLINVARKLPQFGFYLVVGETDKQFVRPRNVKILHVAKDPLKLMAYSSLIICGGGHSTIMEGVCMGKPILSLPYGFHFEQESNASRLEELGFGTRIDQKTPEIILEVLILSHIRDREMNAKLGMISSLAIKLDGRQRLVELVKEGKVETSQLSSLS